MSRTIAAPLAVALALAAAPAIAQSTAESSQPRWALGWENGLTLRHGIGLWDLSVGCGPSYYSASSERSRSDSSLPDSLYADPESGADYDSKARFVRLGAGRLLTHRGPLSLHGTLAVTYTWADYTNETRAYAPDGHVYRTGRNTSERDAWAVDLGARMAWRVLDVLTVQVRAGLVWQTEDTVETSTTIYVDEGREVGTRIAGDGSSLADYGPSGTGSLEFFFWF